MGNGYTPSLGALEAAWIAQRVSKGTAIDVARAEFRRAIAVVKGESSE